MASAPRATRCHPERDTLRTPALPPVSVREGPLHEERQPRRPRSPTGPALAFSPFPIFTDDGYTLNA